MATGLAIREITTAVSVQVRDLVSKGLLQLPADYSADNALKFAMLMIPDVKDKDNVPALKVCTPESIQGVLLEMCTQGLNPNKKQCSFIVRGSKLTLSRSYFGDICVAKQVDPSIEDIFPTAVFQGDIFEYEIKRGKIVNVIHKQKLDNKNKAIVAAYATVVYHNGAEVSTVMTWEQILQAWRQSPIKPVNADGTVKPESTHGKYPEEMAKKTVVHRACKPIYNNSNDSSLLVQSVRRSSDESDAAESSEEISENANQTDFDDVIDITEANRAEAPEQTDKESEADPF